MKTFRNICLIFALLVATVFCMTSCNNGSAPIVTYEISVDTQNVSVDTSTIKVTLYALDGKAVKQEDLTDGKAKFDLPADSYVATLSGLDETVSFSSVLLTKNSKNAKITLDNSERDQFEDIYSYVFTVIVLNGKHKLSDLSAQICDLDLTCINKYFDKGNVVDGITDGGECSVEIFDANMKVIYDDTFTISLDKRFYIVQL